MTINLGSRVKIKESYHWAKGATGTIDIPPKPAQELVKAEAPWKGFTRQVQGANGPIVFYWVRFDKPQFDDDGDGPYPAGEIEAESMTLLGMGE